MRRPIRFENQHLGLLDIGRFRPKGGLISSRSLGFARVSGHSPRHASLSAISGLHN
jgi:hypothetical protein